MLRIGFLGLGGVGGYFGAKISRAAKQSNSHAATQSNGGADNDLLEVVFLASEKTAAAIRANGIRLITPDEEFVAHPHLIVTPTDKSQQLDFLICAVKSYDLEESLEQFRHCISPDTILLPLLNGIDSEQKIQTMFPKNEVWSGCVYIVSRKTAPGVITETGNIHHLHFGGTNRSKCEQLLRILKTAHDDVYLHENIRDVVWEKFIFISTIASLTSYLDVCIGKILQHDGNRSLLETMLLEICAVARAENIVLPENIVPATMGKMKKLPFETTSSMHSDFQRGSRTEFQSLTGHVIALAGKHNLEVPAYQQVFGGLNVRSSFGLP